MPATSNWKSPPRVGPRPISIKLGEFHGNAKNLIGKRFGKLKVISEVGRNHKRSVTWLCTCDCGKSVIRVGSTLLSGKSYSCGCNLWSAESRAKRSATQSKSDSSLNNAYRAYVYAARSRSMEFDLSISEFVRITSCNCFYCGDPPAQIKKSTSTRHLANGIDRVDNRIGYTPENLVSCCMRCNYMKRAMSIEEFIGHCEKIVSRSEGVRRAS